MPLKDWNLEASEEYGQRQRPKRCQFCEAELPRDQKLRKLHYNICPKK